MSRGKERLTAQLVPSPRMASPFMTTTPAQSREDPGPGCQLRTRDEGTGGGGGYD